MWDLSAYFVWVGVTDSCIPKARGDNKAETFVAIEKDSWFCVKKNYAYS